VIMYEIESGSSLYQGTVLGNCLEGPRKTINSNTRDEILSGQLYNRGQLSHKLTCLVESSVSQMNNGDFTVY
jgi:hypothetical protein